MNPTELERELRERSAFSFSRSAGPGGQNVNKLNTKVEAWIDLRSLSCLNQDELNRLRHKLSGRIRSETELYVQVQDNRSQMQNRILALQRLRELILRGLERPKPRLKTKPSRASVERRLEMKRLRSDAKRERRDKDLE